MTSARRSKGGGASTRRIAGGTLLVAGAAVALCYGYSRIGSTPSEARSELPDVVIYLVDTLRADHLGVYGYSRDTSPRLDEFARDSVIYEQAYSPSSWTRPAVASLLTGLDPARHGATSRTSVLAQDITTLAERLRRMGYSTAAIATNPHVLPVWGFAQGFDEFHDVKELYDSTRADQVNEVAFRFLDKQASAPFFLFVHTLDPHAPYDPPPPHDRLWGPPPPGERPTIREQPIEDVIDSYDGEIHFNDEQFGLLVDRLRQDGRYDRSLIVFVSDHGEELEDHGRLGHGMTLYEEVVRVPLVVKLPGNEHASTRVASPVVLQDIVPTVLAAVGDGAPDLDGVDLGGGTARDGRERPISFSLDVLTLEGHRKVIEGLRVGRWKLIREIAPRSSFSLFDLEADPRERHNRRAEAEPVAARLVRQLEMRRREKGMHLWLVGTHRSGESVAEGSLVTSGRFVAFETGDFELGDEAWLSEDATRLSFRVLLPSRPNPAGQAPYRIVDHDRLRFQVEPPASRVTIESFRQFDGAGVVYLGAKRRREKTLPLTVDPSDSELRVEHMASVLPSTRTRSIFAPPGAYLGVIEEVAASHVEPDAELAERLRALGYVP